jgi:hypothetical protein
MGATSYRDRSLSDGAVPPSGPVSANLSDKNRVFAVLSGLARDA